MAEKEIVLGPGAKSDADNKKEARHAAKHPETVTALPEGESE